MIMKNVYKHYQVVFLNHMVIIEIIVPNAVHNLHKK